jgi:hypothetical protein
MAPFARQGATLKKNRRSNPWAIVDAVTHDVKDYGFIQNYPQRTLSFC